MIIDQRELPSTLPAELRRATLLAAELRSDRVARAFVEALSGSTSGVPLGFADAETERFKALVAETPDALLEAVKVAGWKVSPLAAALRLGADRRDPFLAGAHLKLVSDAIVGAVTGAGKRFIAVSMPPRYGKSTLISRRTPAWFLANFPHLFVGVLGYGEQFAETWGRTVRNDLQDSPDRFGFSIAADSSAASHWHTQYGGSMWTAGVGGSVTGKNADLLIIDDPIKSFAEASSQRERDALWNWWASTARTRIMPGSVAILVMTRWHSDDLAGRLLSGFDGTDAGEWLEIKLPAVWEKDDPDLLGRKRGDLLWPARFPQAEVDLTRRSVGEETWSALYQQTPVDTTAIGRVYHAFDDANVRECEFDPRAKLFVGCDFNVDPASAVIGQVREFFGERAYLTNEKITDFEILDEISIPDCNTLALATEIDSRIRKLLAGYPPQKVTVYGDASGNSRRSSASQSDWEIMTDALTKSSQFYSASFDVPEANPNVRDRVASLNGLLRTADRQVRMIVDPKCRQLLADLRQCRWKRDSNGNSTSLIDKSDPKRTHASDALGYAVYRRVKFGSQTFGYQPGLLQ